jgi:hypothetical protein
MRLRVDDVSTSEQDRFAVAVRAVFGRWASARKIETLRLEVIRAGLIPRDEGQAP